MVADKTSNLPEAYGLHAGKGSIKVNERHVGKKEKHGYTYRAHPVNKIDSLLLEKLACYPAFCSAALVNAKIGIALSSETTWLAACSDKK